MSRVGEEVVHADHGDTNYEPGPNREENSSSEEDLEEEHEEDGESSSAGEETLPYIMGPDDPRRMHLTHDEYRWALEIKDLVTRAPEVDNLSDFMYAQHAIATSGNMEDAMRQIVGLQHFRQEYRILDTHTNGCQYLQRLVQLFPRHLLSHSFSYIEGTYVLVHDMTKLETGVLTTKAKVDGWMAASYYIHTTMCPDMATIRKGNIVLIECDGIETGFRKDFSLHQNMFSQLVAVYPFFGESRCFHTGMVFNLIVAMFRKLLPRHLKFVTGLSFEGRLDQFYLIPDVATANARVLRQMGETLKRRYENEAMFRL